MRRESRELRVEVVDRSTEGAETIAARLRDECFLGRHIRDVACYGSVGEFLKYSDTISGLYHD